MGWARYASPKFELEKPLVVRKHVLTPWEIKNPKTQAILPCFHVFEVILTIFLHVSSLGHSELPMCETIHIFRLPQDFGAPGIHHSRPLLCYSFFPGMGSVFVNAQRLGSLLGVSVLFPPLHGWGNLLFSVAQ